MSFEPVDEILKCDQLVKAAEKCFPVVLFAFEPVDEILKYDQ